jgi:hypothetical protein
MNYKKIISDLIEVEAMCEATRQRAYNIRTALEPFQAPAPKEASVKKFKKEFITKFRTRLAKRMENSKKNDG